MIRLILSISSASEGLDINSLDKMTPRNLKVSSYFLNTSKRKRHYIGSDETTRRRTMRFGRNILIPFLLTAFCFLFVFGNLTSQESAEEAFEKALYYEDVQGDLQKAIKLYEQILTQFPESREIAAKAQLHIGLCYEKLGLREATSAYQRVVQNYGEQKEVVAQAQERLLKLTQPERKPAEPEGIRIRQIWKKPYTDSLGSVSVDGRFLSFVYWGEGDVAIHDLVTGEDRILTHEADAVTGGTGFAQEPVFSKDGRQIAYSWWRPNHTYDLFLIDVDNPSPRLLYRKKNEHVYPVEWLSDKELIFSKYDYETKIGRIVCSFNISDGTIRELMTLKPEFRGGLSCSPDGKYIAYDFANETDKGNSDINLLAIDGGDEISLVKHPANDRILGWVPGRKEFLFISDRSGTWDLWSVPLDDGKSSGPVERIYTDIGEVRSVGFTQNGDCYFGFNKFGFNAYIAPFNADTGELEEKSGKTLLGSNYGIGWSADGRYLAYMQLNPNAANPIQLIVQDLETGEERTLTDNLRIAVPPCWSPAGNSILVVGRDRKKDITKGYKGGIYRVDVKTGQTSEVLLLSDYEYNTPGDDAFPLSDIQWSLDGKSVFYLFFRDRLVEHDLETGQDKILYEHSRFERSVLDCSPDGKLLLFGVREEGESHLLTIPVGGGKEKELYATKGGFGRAMWSPDGKYVYFTKEQDGTSLWRLPAEGGVPKKVWESENRVEIFGIHPNGKQMSFAMRERELEIRVIENLVQELKKIYDK
jgi:Tol biopolymer transport system component